MDRDTSGALGIIVPMVSTAEKIKAAVKYAFYPPMGERSQGGGQYRAVWGNDYRQTINDNLLIVAMIETVTGIDAVDEIAGVPGVDVIFAASTDIGSFSGKRQGDPEYEALITRIHDGVLAAGRQLGGPQGWMDRDDFTFFQGPRLRADSACRVARPHPGPTGAGAGCPGPAGRSDTRYRSRARSTSGVCSRG